jgi:hypothetical protein
MEKADITGRALPLAMGSAKSGAADEEFRAALESVVTALQSNPSSLRGTRTSPSGADIKAYLTTKILPGAGKGEYLENDPDIIVYACDYPGVTVEALRDRVDNVSAEKLAWDEGGKQWYRGATDNITLSIQALDESNRKAGASIILTRV